MQKSKLIQLLRLVEIKGELNLLKKFIRSPYHNTNTNLSLLLDYILKYSPDYESNKLNKSIVFRKLFPGQYQTESIRNKLQSSLTQLIKQFMIQQKLNEQFEEEEDRIPLDILELDYVQSARMYVTEEDQRNLVTKLSKQLKNNIQKDIDELSSQNAATYRLKFLLAESATNSLSKWEHANKVELKTVIDPFSVYSFAKLLELSCLMVNHGLSKSIEAKMIDQGIVDELINRNQLMHVPIVRIYWIALNMLNKLRLEEQAPDDWFEQFKETLLTSSLSLSLQEWRPLFQYANTFCAIRINQGEATFYTSLMELYELQLEKGTLIRNGYLDPVTFKNLITISLFLGNLTRAKEFLMDNEKNQRIPIDAPVFIKYNAANIAFHEGQFAKVLDLLIEKSEDGKAAFVKYPAEQPTYKRDLRKLLLKTYYELDYLEEYENTYNSFQVFLHRNKEQFAQDSHAGNHALVLAISQLSKLRNEARFRLSTKDELAMKIKGFINEVEQFNNLIDQKWLRLKIEELQKK